MALEKKRAPALPPWCKRISREEVEASLERMMRWTEEKEQREALLTPAALLALRRKELADMDARPAPADPRLRAIGGDSIERECRKMLLRQIGELEAEILKGQHASSDRKCSD